MKSSTAERKWLRLTAAVTAWLPTGSRLLGTFSRTDSQTSHWFPATNTWPRGDYYLVLVPRKPEPPK